MAEDVQTASKPKFSRKQNDFFDYFIYIIFYKKIYVSL